MALHIDYYASLNSPWTHLGSERIEATEQELSTICLEAREDEPHASSAAERQEIGDVGCGISPPEAPDEEARRNREHGRCELGVTSGTAPERP